MSLYVTADLHFGHRFMAHWRSQQGSLWAGAKNEYGMDDWLIEQWNDRVTRADTVWVLGDFSFHNQADSQAIFDQLPGKKHLVRGNHDPKRVERLGWEEVVDFKRVKWFDEARGVSHTLYLFHYPMLTWPNAHHGSFHLHGHSHGNLRAPESTRLDVGPDSTGQVITSAKEAVEILSARRYDFIDHHEKPVDA